MGAVPPAANASSVRSNVSAEISTPAPKARMQPTAARDISWI